MKRKLILVALAGALAVPLALTAQPYGGPGMMGGGYGPGGYGPGYGMGPGGYGMGPGIMGPGMMGGYGGWGPGYGLDLSAEQRQKLSDIQRELFNQRWQIMEKLHAADGPMAKAWGSGELDEKAARQAYEQMAQAHKQMFEAQLEARKRMDAVLTDEQRAQLKRNYGRWSR